MAKLRTLSRPDVAESNLCKVASHDSEFEQQEVARFPELIEKMQKKPGKTGDRGCSSIG